ncbi:MAG: proline--tRNA ligase [Acidobacteriota bacterium]
MATRLRDLFIPTLREDPAEAETRSHRLLLRAGYIRQLAAGLYSVLPLAQRSLLKITAIVREEMNAIGAQEFHLTALHPAELWRRTGRYDLMGDIMFRLQDRGGREMVLGTTHEEVFTRIASDELRSYRQLPQIWYQIQTKFRDEPRAKSGLLRVREFTMKDSYSFDLDAAGLDASYRKHAQAYQRIFSRCGIEFVRVEASSGAMGGTTSQEFMVRSDAGEDDVASCASCGYAANLETATSRLAPVEDPEPAAPEPAKVSTPGQRTIADIETFLSWPAARQIKTLVYMAGDRPVLALLRGDHELNETKLAAGLGVPDVRPAAEDEVPGLMGAHAGSLGPVRAPDGLRLLADTALRGRRNLACGANEDDTHLTGVTPGVHFQPEWADLRSAAEGEGCPRCAGSLTLRRHIEIGHIFKLGTRYTEALGATVLDETGAAVPMVMGSYGIGMERILAAAAELYGDEAGLALPPAIAPFGCILTLIQAEKPGRAQAAERLAAQMEAAGIEVLVDDRAERPGVKFKDSELIGIPARITVGRGIDHDKVELFDRRRRTTTEIATGQAAAGVRAILAQ